MSAWEWPPITAEQWRASVRFDVPARRTLTGRVVRTATTLERFVPVIVKRIGVSGCEIVAVGPFQGDARDAELTALAKLDADEAKRTAESRALAQTR